MKYAVTLLVIISLSSCISQRRCNERYPQVSTTNIKDSIVITHEIRYFDSTIYKVVEIPRLVVMDSVAVRYENGQAITDRLYLVGKFSQAVAWVDGTKLKGELKEGGWIPVEMKLRLQEKTIKELQAKQSTTVKIVKEKYVPGFVKLLAWVGGIILLLIIFYVIYRVVRIYFKI